MQEPLRVALKEWASVCRLLEAGRVCLTLRKGGVHEWEGPGRFRLEHERFALWPSVEHERGDWLKPELVNELGVADAESNEDVLIRGFAESAGIWEVPSRDAFDELDDLHPWLPPQIDMRFDYKPERPLYAVLLRVSRSKPPVAVPMRDAYLGCRSWVPLEAGDVVQTSDAEPAMAADQLKAIHARVDHALRMA